MSRKNTHKNILSGQAPLLFKEVQHFPVWAYTLCFLPLVLLLVISKLATPDRVYGVLGLVMAILPLLFYALVLRMETRLEGKSLKILFGLAGWIRRTIPLKGARLRGQITYRPFRDYGGYGIRYGIQRLCYNSRGNQGVLIKPAKGLEVLIGSQIPKDLESALKKVL